MSTTFPPEFTAPCDQCGRSIDGPDVACGTTWDIPSGYVEPPIIRAAVWCVECHEAVLCECSEVSA